MVGMESAMSDSPASGGKPATMWESIKAWFAHAFAVEKYDESTLAPEERGVLDKIARQVNQRGLVTPFIVFLQSNRHMNWMGSQAMVFAQPIADLMNSIDLIRLFVDKLLRLFGLQLTLDDYNILMKAFEKRYSIEYLIQRMEAYASGEYNDPPAPASDNTPGPSTSP
jgi:hypothetical protein